MNFGEWIGLVGGLVGIAGAFVAMYVSLRNRADRRWLRRQEIPRQLEDLEKDHGLALTRHREGVDQRRRDIDNDHNARGVYYSSMREDAQRRNKIEGQRDEEKLVRDYERNRSALEAEFRRLKGRWFF